MDRGRASSVRMDPSNGFSVFVATSVVLRFKSASDVEASVGKIITSD